MDASDHSILIRDAAPQDATAIAEIYNYYVLNTTATFEEVELNPAEVTRRMEIMLTASLPYLVMEEAGLVCGFSYAGRWKERSSYRFTVESAIYLRHTHLGRGFGKQLYAALTKRLPDLGVHAIIAGVALPNPASIALHKTLGFVEVALFREVGWKFKRWIDLTYWELLVGSDT